MYVYNFFLIENVFHIFLKSSMRIYLAKRHTINKNIYLKPTSTFNDASSFNFHY